MDKHHILVVDDNHINRLFFDSALKKLNYKVIIAENGHQAIDLCLQHTFDLILMDIRMDGIDGIETAAKIKAINSHHNTPILAISAERFEHDNYMQFENSILKPVSQELLKNTLAGYLTETNKINEGLNCFDHQQALEISHNDLEIVTKLRAMLVIQLSEDWQQIENLYNQKQWQSLNDYLHKVLGSAKVCAAMPLIHCIEQLKINIVQQQVNTESNQSLQKLKEVIDQIIIAADE